MNLSKLWGHLGTVLSGVAAGLTDFHAVASSPDVQIVVTAVFGLLTAIHVISGSTEANMRHDVSGVIKRLSSTVEAAAKAASEAAHYQPPHVS
jgi:hypothetical protein